MTMDPVDTIEMLLMYIDDYMQPEPEIPTLIPDIKSICIILQEATSSYLTFEMNYYNDTANIDTVEIESVVLPNTQDIETKEEQMRKRMEGYQLQKIKSLQKHTEFKRQISSNIINTKTAIFFTIALFTYSPNQSYYDNYYNLLKYCAFKYYQVNDNKIFGVIMQYLSTSLSFCKNVDNSEQITFASSDCILKFDGATDDFMNIISNEHLLLHGTEYDNILINCYIMSKGDEMWLGLIDKGSFGTKKSVERDAKALLYYGGRQRLIGTPKAFGHWDSGNGAIHGFGKVQKKDISYYQHGHWISFLISVTPNDNMVKIYNDDECVFDGNINGLLSDNGIYFMCTVDDEIDAVFIEKAMHRTV
eukprot:3498_1